MWLVLASARGIENALGVLKRVASEMTGDQIADAGRLAREWKPVSKR